jgi:hypothetical protein
MVSGRVMNETTPGNAKKVSYPSKSKGVKKFAEGGLVDEEKNPAGIPTVRGSLPKKARALWDRIPNVKEFARTGKVFPSSEDVDRAERRERAYETNKRK